MSEAFLSALHADPWNDTLVDLPSLNSAVSDDVVRGVESLHESAVKDPNHLKSQSLVFLGPPGAGKTHLFSRLRKKLGPRAVFVHIRPLLHAGLTPGFVLNQAVQQLAQASYGHPQADALVGSLIGHTRKARSEFPMAHITALKHVEPEARKAELETTTDAVLEVFPDLDDVFVERLLELPFVSARKRRALLAWLSGQDCDPSQLQRIGASASMGSEHAVRALRTLGSVAALGAPLVLVFDQLENLIQRDETEERITQYGNLIAELVDATRGLLIVQMALDSEWEQAIEPRFNLSQKSRVVMSKTSVALPTPPQSRQLIELWHGELDQVEAPLPWPFEAAQLNALLDLPGLTPRMLLCAMREAVEERPIGLLLDGEQPENEPAPSESRTVLDQEAMAQEADEETLKEDWQSRLVQAHHILDGVESRRAGIDSDRLCDGLLTAARFCDAVGLRGTGKPYVQIETTDSQGRWLSFVHQAHHRSIGAALDRVLSRLAKSPGLVVREQWRPFSPTWKSTIAKQLEILANDNVTWFELNREDAARLLALEEFVQAARSHDICDSRGRPLEEAVVLDFVKRELRPHEWGLLRELSRSPQERESTTKDARFSIVDLDSVQKGQSSPPPPLAPPQDALGTQLDSILKRLRVASVDRVIREVHRLDPAVGRNTVIEQLKDMGHQIAWHGRNIVSVEEKA